MQPIAELFPLYNWLKQYQREMFISDLMAGIIVAIMLVPQGMAYAFLAGMPPEYGLYAAMLPLLLYALLGSSRSLAVGPVAIASLMVGATIAPYAAESIDLAINAAINLSLLVGLILLLLRSLQLGSVVNFMSHSVLSGFTSAAALIIAISQIKYLFGLDLPRSHSIDEPIAWLLQHFSEINPVTVALSILLFITLWWIKSGLCCLLQRWNWPEWVVQPVCKAGPMFAVIIGTLLVWALSLDEKFAVATVGAIPQGLPQFGSVKIDLKLWQDLFTPALLIALIGFLESVSVGTALASKRRERIDPNKELVALGCANLGAAFSGTFPVAGGFGRSMVNHSAGAQTTIASLISAVLVTVTVICLTPLFFYLPKAALGAIIVMAVVPLIDLKTFQNCWRFNKADAMTLLATFVMVLFLGVELGILSGIGISIALLLYRSSQPHIAVLGRVGNSSHFRNIERHTVKTSDKTMVIRVDESLYFANTRYVEEFIMQQSATSPSLDHIVLVCTAVNFIDASALETLEHLILNLADEGVTLHLAEVKGPVMDQLKQTDFLEHLGAGQVFFTTDEAMQTLAGI